MKKSRIITSYYEGAHQKNNANILIRWWKAIHLYGSCDIHGSQLISTLAPGCQALPRQLLLQHVSLRFTLLLQSVQQWISAWWTSMDQRLYSLFCWVFLLFFFSSIAYYSIARWSQREIKSLLCYLIYQQAEAISTRVAWWIVLSMNRTVTPCIDFAMTEHILVSLCGRWCSQTLGPTNVTALYDPALVSIHQKPSVVITTRGLQIRGNWELYDWAGPTSQIHVINVGTKWMPVHFFRVTCGFKVLCSLVKVQSIMSHNTA